MRQSKLATPYGVFSRAKVGAAAFPAVLCAGSDPAEIFSHSWNLNLVRSLKHRMNRPFVLATALAAGLASSPLLAQAPTAAAPAPTAAAPAAVAPTAVPAKVAIIAFEQGVVSTNEGQKALNDIQKKYEPKKTQIEGQGAEVESLQKQIQALPATTSDEERAKRLKDLDIKQKALQRDEEDAQNQYQSDLQEAYGKVAQKFGGAAVKYAHDNGFTVLLNVGQSQQALPTVLWFDPGTDITQAVINAYNVSSGVAAPPPPAPAPAHRTPAAAPKPATTPHQ
jgi:outer membrane protein